MKVNELRIQHLEKPIGIGTRQPLLSYRLSAEEPDQAQSAYQILAATKKELLDEQAADLWDSGKTAGSRNFGILYQGKPLTSRQRIFWKVRVWDRDGRVSQWSEASCWEMGLLEEKDWTARWIGQGSVRPEEKSHAPVFRKTFRAESREFSERARIYLCGLGLFRLLVNGREVSDSFFDPGESHAGKTVYYVTFDLQPFLCAGENTVEIWLGNGQYTGFLQNPVMAVPDGSVLSEHRYQKNDGLVADVRICGEKKVIAQIELEGKDGVRRCLGTDETWLWGKSPCVFQNWYGGEDYDSVEYETCWKPASAAEAPGGSLTAREFPPIRVRELLEPESIRLLKNGNWLVDFGKNGAGVPEIILHGTTEEQRGTWIRMYPAELLREDGEGVDQASCTQSWNEKYHCSIRDSYRIAGRGEESWHPFFCYHGFQYLEVEGFPGIPQKENFRYRRICTDNEKTGCFSSSDPVLNAVNDMVERSMESNMFSAFTDCPQIEKLGWIETSHLMFRSLADTYDIRAWMRKIIHDICDSQVKEEERGAEEQEPDGYVPAIIPEYQRIAGLHRDPNWNGACIFTPWEYYQYYGEADVLEKSYPVMKRYLEYLRPYLKDGLLREYAQMGEWGENGEHTPEVLVATASAARMFRIAAQAAGILGKSEDQKAFQCMTDRICSSFLEDPECWNKEKKICGTDSQAGYGCALFSDLIPEPDKEATVDRLVRSVERNGFHLTSGEVGLKQVFCTLGENGRSDVVWRMVMNPTRPGYRTFVDAGMTTLPEYWNYDELWYGMARSRNHAMMGHVKEWIMNYLLGIRPLEPGYSRILIQPFFPESIRWMEGKIRCPYGVIRLSCQTEKKEEKRVVTLKAELPVGIRAVFMEPYFEEKCSDGKRILKETGSGIWEFQFQEEKEDGTEKTDQTWTFRSPGVCGQPER